MNVQQIEKEEAESLRRRKSRVAQIAERGDVATQRYYLRLMQERIEQSIGCSYEGLPQEIARTRRSHRSKMRKGFPPDVREGGGPFRYCPMFWDLDTEEGTACDSASPLIE